MEPEDEGERIAVGGEDRREGEGPLPEPCPIGSRPLSRDREVSKVERGTREKGEHPVDRSLFQQEHVALRSGRFGQAVQSFADRASGTDQLQDPQHRRQ